MSHAGDLPTLQAQWQGFERAVVPRDASPAQHKDMRTAFFAGALVVLKTALKVAEIEDEAEAIAIIERYHIEVESFTDVLRLIAAMHPSQESDDD